MPLLYLGLICCIVALYFSYIQIYRLILLPVGLIFGFVGQGLRSMRQYHAIEERVHSHTITLAWLMIMLGLFGLSTALGIRFDVVALGLIGLNIVGWMSSYIVQYDDGKQFFHIGVYVSRVLLIVGAWITQGWQIALIILTLAYIMTMALYGFLCYVIGIFRPVEYRNYYLSLFFLNVSIISVIYRANHKALYRGVFLSQVYIMALYLWIAWINRHASKPLDIPTIVSVEDILAGARVTSQRVIRVSSDRIQEVYEFLQDMPYFVKQLMSSINIILIALLIGLFVADVSSSGLMLVDHVIYWGALIVFVINVLLIKMLDYAYRIQRIFVFFVLHFSVYVSSRSISGGDLSVIALIAVAWNIAHSIVMFYIPALTTRGWIVPQDYQYRLTSNITMLCTNIVILTMLPLSGQLIFSLIFVYIGIQVFLMIYDVSVMRRAQVS